MKINDMERSYDVTFALPLSFADKDRIDMNKLFLYGGTGTFIQNEQFKKYIRMRTI